MPRIAGISVVLMLAAAGVIAALLPGKPHVAAARRAALPAKVRSVQAIGLVDAGPPSPPGAAASPETLLASRAGLAFTPGLQAMPDWTADQMADGTYIFIDVSNGRCLGAAAAGRAAVLQRCDLGYAQRWRRQDPDTRGYWQIRNAGNGRCLTATATATAAGGNDDLAARLEPCAARSDWHQRITYSPTY